MLAAFCQHLAASSFWGQLQRKDERAQSPFPALPLPPRRQQCRHETQDARFICLKQSESLSPSVCLAIFVVVSFAYCCSWKVGYVVIVIVITLPGPSPVQIKLKVLSALQTTQRCLAAALSRCLPSPPLPLPPPSLHWAEQCYEPKWQHFF